MSNAHCRVCGVDVLTTRTRCAIHINAEVVVVDFKVEFFGFHHDCHGCRRCMNAALCFGSRHALHAVWPTFKLQVTPRIITLHQQRDLVDATHFRVIELQCFHRPTALRGVCHVHLHKVARKQVCFFATLSTTNFHNDWLAVIHIRWQQEHLQTCFKFFHASFCSCSFGTKRFTFVARGFDH